MKSFKYLFVLLLLFFSHYFSASSNLKMKPIDYDFNGVVISDKNVIAYSDAGYCMITTDKGNTWMEKEVYDYGSIQSLIDKDDALWGVMDIGVFLKSTNNGISFETHSFEIEKGDTCFTLAVSDNNLFVRTKNKILKYDKQYNLLAEFDDPIIKCDTMAQELYKIYISPFKYMTYIENNLLVSVSKQPYNGTGYNNGNGDILVLDNDLKVLDTIDLIEKVQSVMNKRSVDFTKYRDFYGHELNTAFEYKDGYVFIIKSLPFFVDKTFSDWDYFFKDSDIGRYYHAPNTRFNFVPCDIRNDKYYCAYNDVNKSIYYIKNFYGKGTFFSTKGICRYNEEIDSLGILGELFDNSYYTSQAVGMSRMDAITFSLRTKNMVVLDDSFVVFAGLNKTILQSKELGKNWELVSHINNPWKILSISNDSTFYYLELFYKQIIRTIDGGKTLLPVEVDTLEHYPYFQDLDYSEFIFTMDEEGRGIFTCKFNGGNVIYTTIPELAYTEDFGRTYKWKHCDSMRLSFTTSLSNIIDFEKKWILALNYRNNDSTRIVCYTKDTFEYEHISTDTTMIIHHILADDPQNFFVFADVFDDEDQTYEVRKTEDGSKKWQTVCTINHPVNSLHHYTHSKDSIFISTINPNRVYLFDRNRNTIDTLFRDDDTKYRNLQLLCISDHFFIIGDSTIYKNTNRNDLSQWQKEEWEYGTPLFVACKFIKGNMVLVEMGDEKHPIRQYKLTIDQPTSVSESVEFKETAHFYAARPYPLPAKNSVRSKVFWDSDYRIENAWIRIYDILGQEVSTKDMIKVENIESYSAEVVWDCSQMNPGIYFIVLDYHGQTKTIPVVVGR